MLPQPFLPLFPTQSVTAGTTYQNVALGKWETPEGGVVHVTNAGSAIAYIALGNSTTVATQATGIPILANTVVALSMRGDWNTVSVMSPGSTEVFITQGRYGH